jgi:hypothetical protein
MAKTPQRITDLDPQTPTKWFKANDSTGKIEETDAPSAVAAEALGTTTTDVSIGGATIPVQYETLIAGSGGTTATWELVGLNSLAHKADTDPGVLAYNASGIPVTVGPGTAGHMLISLGDSAAPIFNNIHNHFGISIETPAAADVIPVFLNDMPITITHIIHQCWGATNVIWRLYQGTGQGTGGTAIHGSDITSTTTLTTTVASGGDLTVPADTCIWYDATSISGTPTNLVITVFYTED